MAEAGKKRRPVWDSGEVRSLRRRLGLTQAEMARLMGARQQTISEWETGLYRPRGLSATLLSLIAERADVEYRAGGASKSVRPAGGERHGQPGRKDRAPAGGHHRT